MVYILIVTDPNLTYDIEEAVYKKLLPEDKKKYVLDEKIEEVNRIPVNPFYIT